MKSKITIALIALVASIALFACASSGRKFDTTHVNDIKTAVHDQAQMKTWFGEPLRVQSLSGSAKGCILRWTYVYAHSVAGGSTWSHALIVDFNAAGKVCDHAYVKQRQ